MAKPSVSDEDGEKFGDPLPFDPSFSGPVKNRSCTDILCLFLFVAFLAGWAVVSAFAYKYGDPAKLLNPTDTFGNICGAGDFQDKPFLFFFDLTKCAKATVVFKGCNTPQVCVKSCPDESFSVKLKRNDGVDDTTIKSMLKCQYGTDMDLALNDLIKTEKCASYYLKSYPLAGRCLPFNLGDVAGTIQSIDNVTVDEKVLKEAGANLGKFLSFRDFGEKVFQDFSASWKMMILFLLFSMVVSFVWILLMRWISGAMVLLSIVLVVVLLGFASGFSFYTYWQLDHHEEPDAFKLEFIKSLDTFTSSKKTWLASGIIFGIVWLILVLTLIFLRKRINLAIALIKEGSKAVGCTISSLFFPILPYLLQLVVFVFWGSIAVCIASSGKMTGHLKVENGTGGPMIIGNSSCDIKKTNINCVFTKYEGEDNLFRAQIYNLFGLFWGLFFVVGLGQVSLAGAFASYYWAFSKPHDVPSFAVAGGMWRAFRFHMGSVAFGSLLISIVRMIRVLLEYIDQQCKKYDNPFTKVIICCCKCCFWCLERFMKFLSKNAYIMMAVYGKNFCTSAKDSFKLLMRNVVRVVVLDKVTDYLLFLGKLVVVGITAVGAFFFFSGKVQVPLLTDESSSLNYYFLPVISVTFGAYLIATGFFNVYSMAVDTLFLCFLEDCERNNGSTERPYYMSRELMKILGKKNKFREQSN